MAEVLAGYAMSNRILLAIHNIIKNDTELEDFTIVSTETNSKNKSPVLYESHNLGLESWCIKPVYQYVCDTLFKQRKMLASRKLSYDKMENLNCYLNGALLINPDVNTFWNMKRELVEKDITSVDIELNFSRIVLTHKSKSNEAFAYRRWLLKKIVDKLKQNKLLVPPNLIENELAVVHMASEKSQNNYHSWNHRIWCVENLAKECSIFNTILLSELFYTYDWINQHVSEHSGYHYRQYLIKLLRNDKFILPVYDIYYSFVINKLGLQKEDECSNLLLYLFGKHNKKLILEENSLFINFVCVLLYDLVHLFDEVDQVYFDHQSLYYHRRFVIYHLLRVPFEYNAIEYPKSNAVRKNINLWEENIVSSETVINMPSNIKFIKNNNIGSCKLIEFITNHEKTFISDRKSYLTQEYYKWLKNIVGFE